MRYLLFLLFVLLTACQPRSIYLKSRPIPYTEKEFNLLCAITYLQNELNDCNDTCFVTVNGEFNFFDDCLFGLYPELLKKQNYQLNSVVNLSYNYIHVEGFGDVFVSGKGDRSKDVPDYIFSPVLYNNESRTVIGAVQKSDGRKFYYYLHLIKDKLYFKFSHEYYFTCNEWF